jgi:hypothetical protein
MFDVIGKNQNSKLLSLLLGMLQILVYTFASLFIDAALIASLWVLMRPE